MPQKPLSLSDVKQMQSDVNFPLVLCKPTSQIIQPKFNQCKRFVLHPHFPFIYLTISILGSSIIFRLSLIYTLRFVPSTYRCHSHVRWKTGCHALPLHPNWRSAYRSSYRNERLQAAFCHREPQDGRYRLHCSLRRV